MRGTKRRVCTEVKRHQGLFNLLFFPILSVSRQIQWTKNRARQMETLIIAYALVKFSSSCFIYPGECDNESHCVVQCSPGLCIIATVKVVQKSGSE